MSKDPVRRQAARAATLIALPIAVAVAAISLWTFGAFRDASPEPSPSAPAPTSAVSLPAPSLEPAAAGVCQAVVAELPETLLGTTRRPVTAGAEQNAAYGEPPVTLQCGVAPVVGLAPTDMVNLLGGVCWFGKVVGDGSVWTTVDRQVPVAVTVPGQTSGSAQSVIPFSAAVGNADPVLATAPSGCTG